MKKKLNEKKNTYSIENPVVPSSRKHSAASLVTLLTVCFVKKKNREKKESQSQNQIPTYIKSILCTVVLFVKWVTFFSQLYPSLKFDPRTNVKYAKYYKD